MGTVIGVEKTGYRYGATISHMDTQQYAKTERDIDSLIHTTGTYSNDLGMSFGLDKCGPVGRRREAED